MMVSKKIQIDLLEQTAPEVVCAVQNDRYCRRLEVELYAGGESWPIPEDASAVIRYSKADGTGGEYDTLPDGSTAWSAQEHILTLHLAPQMLTVPGPVEVSVSLCREDAQITTFAWMLNVQPQVGAEAEDSGGYYCVPRFLPAPEKAGVGQFFRVKELDEQGRIRSVEPVDIVQATEAVFYTPQVLTGEQQRQARDNLDVLSGGEVLTMLEGRHDEQNLLEEAQWDRGYLTWEDTVAELAICTNGEVYTENRITVRPGKAYLIEYRTTNPNYGWLGWHEYDAKGNWLRRVSYDAYAGQMPGYTLVGDVAVYSIPYTASEDAYGLRLFGRTFLYKGSTATEEAVTGAVEAAKTLFYLYEAGTGVSRLLPVAEEGDEGCVLELKDGAWQAVRQVVPASVNGNIRSINHRGYNTVAPENTLAAFRLSRKMGFDTVETDVAFTADGVAVLLHDDSVDRTSNGSGKIGELTFDAVRALDFGSWKGDAYAGEKIPTFAEFLALCRKLGLKAYVDIKAPATREQVEGLVAAAKRYALQDKISWITAAGGEYLAYVRNADEKARVGLVCETVNADTIVAAVELRSGGEVFLDVQNAQLTGEIREQCMEQEIPVEVWDLWSAEQILGADSYISGFTTDEIIAGTALWEAEQE